MSIRLTALIVVLVSFGAGGCNRASGAKCWEVGCALQVSSHTDHSSPPDGAIARVTFRFALTTEQAFEFRWFENPLCNVFFDSASATDTLISGRLYCAESVRNLPEEQSSLWGESKRKRTAYRVEKQREQATTARRPIVFSLIGVISDYGDNAFIVSFNEDVYFSFQPDTVVTLSIQLPEQSPFVSDRDATYAYIRAIVSEVDGGIPLIEFVPVDASGARLGQL